MKFFCRGPRKNHYLPLLIAFSLLTISACTGKLMPVSPEGVPNFAPGSPASYWIWYDQGYWHLRATTAINPSRFSGTISTEEGEITEVKLFNTEKKEAAQLEGPGLLRLDLYARANAVGVDFKSTAKCLYCDLKIDGKYYKKLIYAGKKEETPSSVPFFVCIPEKGKLPQPKVPKPVKKEEPPAKEEPKVKEEPKIKEEPKAKEETKAKEEPKIEVEPKIKEETIAKEEPKTKEEPRVKEEPKVQAPVSAPVTETTPQLIVTEGKPTFGPASEVKYWIWHEGASWHLRTTTAGKVREFSGRIIAKDGTLENINASRPEGTDFKIARAPSVFEFAYKSVGAIDGIDWQSKALCLEFQLSVDGKSDPDAVRVGLMSQVPTAAPFTLCQQKPIIKMADKPRMKEKAQGFVLWRDRDGWHLRTTVASRGLKMEGTILHPGGGRGEIKATYAVKTDFSLSGEDTFTFSFKAQDKEDGFDWQPANSCAVFDLKINGEHRPNLIYIGSEATTPEVIPFGLCQ